MSKLRNGFVICSINILLLFIIILILEVSFGSWTRENTLNPLDRLNIPRAYKKVQLIKTHYTIWDANYSRDEKGLRGNYGMLSNIGILAVGGSTTDQMLIDDKETWTSILQQNFKASGKNLSIANAGIDGHSTLGHIFAFDSWLSRLHGLKPKWVIAYVGINDLNGSKSLARFLNPIDPQSPLEKIRKVIGENSAILNLFQVLDGIIDAEIRFANHRINYRRGQWTSHIFVKSQITQEEDKNIIEYKIRLKKLVNRIRRLGAEPVLVTQPLAEFRQEENFLKIRNNRSPKLYYKMFNLNKSLMAVCYQLSAICIDLEKELEFSEDDFYDAFHNTPSGAKKIGDYLFRKLRHKLN